MCGIAGIVAPNGQRPDPAALARMALPAHICVTVVPPGEPRTKPRALNLALLEARGVYAEMWARQQAERAAELVE